MNTVKFTELRPELTTIGINRLSQLYETDYTFLFDQWIEGLKSKTIFVPRWFKQDVAKYNPIGSDEPIFGGYDIFGAICLGFKTFTASVAINWAILQGATDIYLVGIDHINTAGPFTIFDGSKDGPNMNLQTHEGFKRYVYAACDYANIYQCNPSVASDWKLEYKDIRDLYV